MPIRFCARAWLTRPNLKGLPHPVDIPTLKSYSDILDQLDKGLPACFGPKLDEVRRGLPLLFRPDYPLVINHRGDRLDMNIHVEEHTGHITGIVGWADARIAPFGISLAGLEEIIGVETTSWQFHPRHEDFRVQFWRAFYEAARDVSDQDREAIEIASLFGLFLRYGFDVLLLSQEFEAAAGKKDDEDYAYLRAFVLRGEEAAVGEYRGGWAGERICEVALVYALASMFHVRVCLIIGSECTAWPAEGRGICLVSLPCTDFCLHNSRPRGRVATHSGSPVRECTSQYCCAVASRPRSGYDDA